jgi:uncharacterized membrane-anchored protein YhcB (DUF1043 family)
MVLDRWACRGIIVSFKTSRDATGSYEARDALMLELQKLRTSRDAAQKEVSAKFNTAAGCGL